MRRVRVVVLYTAYAIMTENKDKTNMPYIIIAVLFIVIIIVLYSLMHKVGKLEWRKPTQISGKYKRKYQYKYNKKSSIMTKTEVRFYEKLNTIMGEKYYIVPQAHLSTFLNHKIPRQNWRGAFSVINGKSVDFLVCDKETSKPVIAIELDDWTHMKADRIERDELVNTILSEADVLLVRFRAGEWDTSRAIFDKIVGQIPNFPLGRTHSEL